MVRFMTFVLGALIALSPACDTVGGIVDTFYPPGVGIASVDITDIDTEAVTLTFGIDVDNPFSVPLPVGRIGYALASDGKPLLSGRAAENVVVPAKKSQIIPVTARLPFADAIAALQSVRPGSVVPYTATFDVLLEVPGADARSFPLERSGKFPIPAVPKITLDRIAWESLSFQEARGVLDLTIENVNDFPVDLEALSYALSLSGVEIARTTSRDIVRFGANDADELEIEIALQPSSLGMAAFNVLSGQKAGYELAGEMQLDSAFGAIALPFRSTGQTAMTK